MADVNVVENGASLEKGAAGVVDQANGSPVTVSQQANANGGIAPGNLIETDIDKELFAFEGEEPSLMNLMLKAKSVSVKSPIVEHYMIDEPRCQMTTNADLSASTGQTATLPLDASDQNLAQKYDTIIVKNVNGYDENGVETPGQDLMLFVVGTETSSNNPIVRAVNGVKSNATDLYSKVPAIPSGTKLVILDNALYETQHMVPPASFSPQPTLVYLQKRGMTQIVSDYFDAQKKRIPFGSALIAEQMIRNFKRRGNRTLWVGRKGKFIVRTEKVGDQNVYTTEGIRWQVKKEFQHSGSWTIEQIIALTKMYFTGEDVPRTGLALCGKNFLENIQCVDYSKHPEIQIQVATNTIGWKTTRIHTVFGDIDIMREPALDKLGYSNSAMIIGEDRLVHYKYTQEHNVNEKIEGEEAKSKSIVTWDALALKGGCHLWIDGEGEGANSGSTVFYLWDSATAPTTEAGVVSDVYYLLSPCAGISESSKKGELWQYNGSAWAIYTGDVSA